MVCRPRPSLPCPQHHPNRPTSMFDFDMQIFGRKPGKKPNCPQHIFSTQLCNVKWEGKLYIILAGSHNKDVSGKDPTQKILGMDSPFSVFHPIDIGFGSKSTFLVILVSWSGSRSSRCKTSAPKYKNI